ncbi:GNAT family N-acetyltransferase [Nocardioides lijunqiniae]|uniref:GNAT family N-acetyltransferase n=1 Tax=Nocardioides lijunqiniae TaxID=2760832 RepID=UPI001877D8E9|nr:GNAT family protein [Nocardioides lijunqiniae]
MSLPAPTVHSARLRLRPFVDADTESLYAMHSDAHVLRYWDAPPWQDPTRAQAFLSRSREMAEEGSGVRLVLELASDGSFLGWIGLTHWDPAHHKASLGYVLAETAWGHGYATEAGRAVLQWAFDTLDLNRVQAETDTRNLASARVLEKLGFRHEGTLREDCVVAGDLSDSFVFGLLRREWQAA